MAAAGGTTARRRQWTASAAGVPWWAMWQRRGAEAAEAVGAAAAPTEPPQRQGCRPPSPSRRPLPRPSPPLRRARARGREREDSHREWVGIDRRLGLGKQGPFLDHCERRGAGSRTGGEGRQTAPHSQGGPSRPGTPGAGGVLTLFSPHLSPLLLQGHELLNPLLLRRCLLPLLGSPPPPTPFSQLAHVDAEQPVSELRAESVDVETEPLPPLPPDWGRCP